MRNELDESRIAQAVKASRAHNTDYMAPARTSGDVFFMINLLVADTCPLRNQRDTICKAAKLRSCHIATCLFGRISEEILTA